MLASTDDLESNDVLTLFIIFVTSELLSALVLLATGCFTRPVSNLDLTCDTSTFPGTLIGLTLVSLELLVHVVVRFFFMSGCWGSWRALSYTADCLYLKGLATIGLLCN